MATRWAKRWANRRQLPCARSLSTAANGLQTAVFNRTFVTPSHTLSTPMAMAWSFSLHPRNVPTLVASLPG